MAIDAQSLINRTAASGYPKLSYRNLWECLAFSAAGGIPNPPPSTDGPILSNGAGGFCQLVVSVNGEVGAQTSSGPATVTVPVLADGSGGFWQIVTDGSCQRGTTSVAGPATSPVVILDADSVAWTLIVDVNGNLGATS